jgi:flagella basal body P-ring formation protein FlgA
MLNQILKNMTYLFKGAIFLFVTLHVMIGLAIASQNANAATLKSVSIIESDVLTVGDIFDDVTRNADYVLGAAPKPGQDMTLNAKTLNRIAVALNLPWRPTSHADQITIRREATIIPYQKIEDTLKKQINNKGVYGNYKVTLNNGEPSIILPNNMAATIDVTDFHYDLQKDYFVATLVSPSRDNPVKKMEVSGMVERLVKIPVLSRNLQNGDIIGESDITFINIPQGRLQHDIIMSKDKLIGMTPRRIGHAGKFILEGTLQRPQIVSRGEPITIQFREGPLTLTAKGRALQSGAKGDMIRVKNMNSSKSLDAIVTASNLVVVK